MKGSISVKSTKDGVNKQTAIARIPPKLVPIAVSVRAIIQR
jgi:hypothetical protein